MKKSYLAILAVASICLLASCKKDNPSTGNGGLKDDENTENPGGDNPGGENPGDDTDLHASLQGSAYVTVALDAQSTEAIKSKIKASYQVDDTNVFLYVWENTYSGGTAAGLNFDGEAEGWTSLVVGTVGWSGAGWCVVTPATIPAFVESSSDLANWKFHLAYKGAANVAHIVILTWNGSTYKFAIGEGALEDNGTRFDAIPPVGGTFKAGLWNEYEIALTDTGLNYTRAAKADNLVSILSGGVTGTTLDVDAMFFYKK